MTATTAGVGGSTSAGLVDEDRQQTPRRRESPPPPPPTPQPPLPVPSFRCVWCLAPTPALYYRSFSRGRTGGGADGAKKAPPVSSTNTSDVRLVSCGHCHAPSVDPYCEREWLLILLDLALLRRHAYRHVLLNHHRTPPVLGTDPPSSSPFDSGWTGLAGTILLCGLLQECALWDDNPALGQGPIAVIVGSPWWLLMRFLALWGCLVLSGTAFLVGAGGAAIVVVRRPTLPWPVLGWALAFPALAMQSAALFVNVWEESGNHGGEGRTTAVVVGALGSLLSLAYRAVAVQALLDAHDVDRRNPTAAPTLSPTSTTTSIRWWKAATILGVATASRAGISWILADSIPRATAAATDEGATPPDSPLLLRLCTGLSAGSLMAVVVPSAMPHRASWHGVCLT